MSPVIAELKKTISASRLNTFHQCRLKFFFRYVAELEKPVSPALHVGTTVHAVLQAWNQARWKGSNPKSFQEVFDQSWDHPEREVTWRDKDETEQRQNAWTMLETYFRETPIPGNEKPLGVEVGVETDLVQRGFPKLVGIIDLVRPGGRIVDFKTAAQTPQPERTIHQNQTQLTCYGLLYREATGQQESGFELHHLVKLKTPKIVVVSVPPVTAAHERRLFRGIESYLEGLDRQDFVPSPGMGCLACEYFRECRAWSGHHAWEGRAAA